MVFIWTSLFMLGLLDQQRTIARKMVIMWFFLSLMGCSQSFEAYLDQPPMMIVCPFLFRMDCWINMDALMVFQPSVCLSFDYK